MSTIRIQEEDGREEVWTERKLEARLGASMYAGEAVGFEASAALANKKAAEFFLARKDDIAAVFRSFAETLLIQSVEMRSKQAKRKAEGDEAQ